MRSSRLRFSVLATGFAAFVATGVAGCGASAGQPSDTGADSPAEPGAAGLSLTDGWVKATDEHMTAAFGTLTNDSGSDVRVVSVDSPIAQVGELHEMAGGAAGGSPTMREKEGGFVVPADGEYVLEPGGDHVMLMELQEPVLAGQDVPITLVGEDGSTVEFSVVARSFSGANEEYDGGSGN